MSRRGKVSPHPPKEIVGKIREVNAELEKASKNDGLMTAQLMKLIHRQTRELAKIFHQLSHLHPRKEGRR